jgi:hypothetical protein
MFYLTLLVLPSILGLLVTNITLSLIIYKLRYFMRLFF